MIVPPELSMRHRMKIIRNSPANMSMVQKVLINGYVSASFLLPTPPVGSLFEVLCPNVIVSNTNAAYNLTVSNGSSTHW
jgi:hypothetical protein